MKTLDKLGAGRTARIIVLALLLAIILPSTHAATLRAGPGEQITRIADAPRQMHSLPHLLYVGGIAKFTITGNTVGQSAKTQNPVLISYGAEGSAWPNNALTLRNNTLISDTLPGGWFLRVHENKFPTPPSLDIDNNETKDIGILSPVLQ